MGIGTWGLNQAPSVGRSTLPTFVFWVGIGHAGTLDFRRACSCSVRSGVPSVNRSAEAMTLFAVMCAGLFPVIHMGRPWLAFWMAPYPNTRGPLCGQFQVGRLLWDVFAISTYLLISAVCSGTSDYFPIWQPFATGAEAGLAQSASRRILCLSAGTVPRVHGHRYETVYMLLAGLATPLVFSVHTIVSMDFATSVIPGWHTTIFPPYFVAGAIFSGLAMVLTLMIIARTVMNLENYITLTHIDRMCKLMLSMGCIVGLAYGTEFFMAFYSGNGYEQFVFKNRALGPFSWAYWTMVTCNVVIPQLLWFRKSSRLATAGVHHCHFRQRWHVVRAIRHHCHQPSSRLSAIELG